MLVDLSHPIADGLVTYPGLPTASVTTYLSREDSRSRYADGHEFHIGCISMVGNSGTYLDTPFHRFADGWDLAELDLSLVVGVPGVVVDGAATGPTTAAAFEGVDVEGRAVLVRTGWSRRFGEEGYGDPSHPHLDGGAAQLLADRGATLVGIDSVNIDGTATGARPVHTILLGAGIPVVEHLTALDRLDAAAPFTFTAVPVKVAGLGTFPVRAFATIDEREG